MPYVVAWDEAAPSGATVDAATLDTEIQNFKIAVRERMDQLLSNQWGVDGDDPKLISKIIGSYSAYNVDTTTETANVAEPEVMILEISGTTDANGELVVDFDNLTGTPTASEWQLIAALSYSKSTRVDNVVLDAPNNELGFRVVRISDGSIVPSFLTSGVTAILVKTV